MNSAPRVVWCHGHGTRPRRGPLAERFYARSSIFQAQWTNCSVERIRGDILLGILRPSLRLKINELIDLTDSRIAIEEMAIRKAIAHGDLEWEAQVLSSFHRLSRTPLPTSVENHAAWALAHRQFHEALVAPCGSPRIPRLCAIPYDKSERYRNLAERSTHPDERDTASEHRELMDVIALERNADKAAALPCADGSCPLPEVAWLDGWRPL